MLTELIVEGETATNLSRESLDNCFIIIQEVLDLLEIRVNVTHKALIIQSDDSFKFISEKEVHRLTENMSVELVRKFKETAAPPPPLRSLTNPGPPSSRPPIPSRVQASAPPNLMGKLMEQIKQGVPLKKVDTSISCRSPSPSRVQASAPPPLPPSTRPLRISATFHRALSSPAPPAQNKPSNNITAPPPPPPPIAPAPKCLSQMSEVVSAPPPPSLPPIHYSHVNLMNELKRGVVLRHVSPEKKTNAVVNSMGLMGQIRPRPLKKVDSDGSQGGPAPGIAELLQRRAMVMGMSSSEDEDSGEDDDEWNH